MTEQIALKNCPFCKSDRITVWSIRDGQQAVCKDCHATGAPQHHGPADQPSAHERARTAWNTRAASDLPVLEGWKPIAKELDRLALVIESAVWEQEPRYSKAVMDLIFANRAMLSASPPDEGSSLASNPSSGES